ncbi:hypothetical protein ABFS82_11G120000 [Erythranthe guttata]|uniref:BAG family molecular chaperone regulator 8, chloroplastic isoform X3 n=1 Tax=Erythranthe guttata TaxID=4155 RepID=UPI00064DC238|nr:PREDICTED: BAG family molecular chaperone regulator 8, chloroplastic isoform X3 [Erythranthe guttata]|eukprot:XP_012840597.1 PREDICTED: BAG family molecular chaperone regulator 8, chloroplastic isoform X3 [Erythranthe guttata]
MAAHHHPCHHPPAAANPTYCHCHCYSPTYTPCLHPQPPDPHPHHHPPHQPHPYSTIPHLPNPPQYNEPHQNHYFQEEIRTYPAVSSLLRRIAALESALGRRSSHSSSFHSLRDAAARTIQTHFRSFLLRRSVTLRHLKDLASIKSTLGILKSSISEKSLFNYDVVYHKAMDLLLKLDTIKGGDPMIRNGKASVSRDLNRFFDFIDGVYVQRRGLSLSRGVNVKSIVSDSVRKTDNVKHGGQKRVQMEKLKALVSRIDKLAEELDEEEEEEEQDEVIEKPSDGFTTRNRAGLLKQRGGVHPKVKKNVSFAENGKVCRVLRKAREPILEDYCNESNDRDSSVDAEDEDFSREVEEIGVSSKDDDEEEEDDEDEDQLENGDEKGSRIYSTSGDNFERKRYENEETDEFVFSAPMPAKMEKRGATQTTRERN